LTLGRILRLGTIPCVFLSRLFMLVTFVFFGYRALKHMPLAKSAMALTMLCPMALMMASSFSYDAMLIVAAMNFIALIFKMCTDGVGNKDIYECAVWAFVLGGIKAGGYLVLLILVGIPLGAGKCDKRKLWYILGAGLASVLFFDVLLVWGKEFFQFTGETDEYLTTAFAWEQPVKYFYMVVNTYVVNADGYVGTMLGSKLGWLSVGVKTYILYLMVIMAALCMVNEKAEWIPDNNAKKYMKLTLMVLLITLPAMLLRETYVFASTISGLQGRYYLPVLPLVMMFLIRKRNDCEKQVSEYFVWWNFLNMFAVGMLLRSYVTGAVF